MWDREGKEISPDMNLFPCVVATCCVDDGKQMRVYVCHVRAVINCVCGRVCMCLFDTVYHMCVFGCTNCICKSDGCLFSLFSLYDWLSPPSMTAVRRGTHVCLSLPFLILYPISEQICGGWVGTGGNARRKSKAEMHLEII